MGCGHSKINIYTRKSRSKNSKKVGAQEKTDEENQDKVVETDVEDAESVEEPKVGMAKNSRGFGGSLLSQSDISTSQQDFFKMLDEKIENGPDYNADCEREKALENARLYALLKDWETASAGSRSLPSTPKHRVKQPSSASAALPNQTILSSHNSLDEEGVPYSYGPVVTMDNARLASAHNRPIHISQVQSNMGMVYNQPYYKPAPTYIPVQAPMPHYPYNQAGPNPVYWNQPPVMYQPPPVRHLRHPAYIKPHYQPIQQIKTYQTQEIASPKRGSYGPAGSNTSPSHLYNHPDHLIHPLGAHYGNGELLHHQYPPQGVPTPPQHPYHHQEYKEPIEHSASNIHHQIFRQQHRYQQPQHQNTTVLKQGTILTKPYEMT